jgi:hypothetical protein
MRRKKADPVLEPALYIVLEVPMLYEFLTSKFDNFFFMVFGARSDEGMNESFLLFRCS